MKTPDGGSDFDMKEWYNFSIENKNEIKEKSLFKWSGYLFSTL